MFEQNDPKSEFLKVPKIARSLIVLHVVLSLFYFLALAFWFPTQYPFVLAALLFGEVFHLWQAFTFNHTIWHLKKRPEGLLSNQAQDFYPPVDVFITVAGEPLEILKQTAMAALNIDYPRFRVFLLNDGYILKKPNWVSATKLAKELGIRCITRKFLGGAKAGNINNALRKTKSPFVAILDADHIPKADFLKKTIPHFLDEKVGFVQSPQYYRNHAENEITGAAWEQQAVFFGAICVSKNSLNSVTMCGTNMVIRREALFSVGGICQTNIAEDFLTGLFMHEKGWKSVYVPEVLAEGLAPEDILSYAKQHFRWARGSLEVIFTYNPLWRHGLNLKQKLQYLTSASYFLSGPIVLLNALLPVFVLLTGMRAVETDTMNLAAIFLPYMLLTVYLLQRATNFSLSFRAVAFSASSFWIQIQALWAVLWGEKSEFSITSKKKLQGNFLPVVLPHIIYVCLAFWAIYVGVQREGWTASIISNVAWIAFNLGLFLPFIASALPVGRFTATHATAKPAI